jgi:hypothetical protein
VAHSPLTAT